MRPHLAGRDIEFSSGDSEYLKGDWTGEHGSQMAEFGVQCDCVEIPLGFSIEQIIEVFGVVQSKDWVSA